MSASSRSADITQAYLVPFGEFQLDPGIGSVRLHLAVDDSLNPGACSCNRLGGDLGGDPNAVFLGQTVSPQPIVEVIYDVGSSFGTPTSLKAQLTWNGTVQSQVTFGISGPGAYLFDLQVANPVTSTAVYPWSVTVTATAGSATQTQTRSGNVAVVVNPTTGIMGAGWSLGSVDQLVTSGTSLIWVSGSGGARVFTAGTGGSYVSPANDFGTLVKNGDNTYTYADQFHTTYNFDTSGNIVKIVDPHNLTRTYAYSSGLLSTISELMAVWPPTPIMAAINSPRSPNRVAV
jgi:hypothetical protein